MNNNHYHDAGVAARYDAENSREAVTIDDIPFYLRLAGETAAMGEAVLELGCGTGRVTLPIAQIGIDITGVDSSAEMLAVARSKSVGLDCVSWLQADMSNFDLGRGFGLVIIPFRSFQMLLRREQQLSCLARIHEHLLPGGRLAFNVSNPHPAIVAVSTHQRSPGEAVVQRLGRNLRLRLEPAAVIGELLTESGFVVESLSGWFDGRAFDQTSSEMVWMARKR